MKEPIENVTNAILLALKRNQGFVQLNIIMKYGLQPEVSILYSFRVHGSQTQTNRETARQTKKLQILD